MNILSEFEENQFLLANACKTADEKARLNHAYLHIRREIDSKPIEVCLYDGVEECICSARTYFHISELICRPQDTVIVDCGCNAGLQQVFFNNCYKYIGVDIIPNFIKISDNAEFIRRI